MPRLCAWVQALRKHRLTNHVMLQQQGRLSQQPLQWLQSLDWATHAARVLPSYAARPFKSQWHSAALVTQFVLAASTSQGGSGVNYDVLTCTTPRL